MSTRGGKREGSGRKKITTILKKITISIAVSSWVVKFIDKKAKAQAMSKSQLIEEIIVDYFNLKKPPI